MISEAESIFRKITSLLHFAMRTRNAVTGYNSLMAMNRKKIGLILIEKGTSESTVKKLLKNFPDTVIKILPEEKGPGMLTGKHGVKILGIKRSEFETEIKKHLKSLEI